MDDNTQTAADTEAAAPVSQEQTPAPVSTEAATPKPAEQQAQQPDSSQDIESLIDRKLKDRDERLFEELRRTRQSVKDTGDSIVQRVREEYGKRKAVLDELEKDGVIGPDVAAFKRAQLRDQVEDEIITSTRAVSHTQTTQPQRNASEAYVWNETGRLFQDSGLSTSDPEFAYLPKELPPGDPIEAVDLYRKAVNKAKREKAARLASEKDAAAAKLKSAQAAAVVVDTGASGAAVTKPEVLLDEMQKLLKTHPRDPRERAQINKRLNEIEEALSKQ